MTGGLFLLIYYDFLPFIYFIILICVLIFCLGGLFFSMFCFLVETLTSVNNRHLVTLGFLFSTGQLAMNLPNIEAKTEHMMLSDCLVTIFNGIAYDWTANDKRMFPWHDWIRVEIRWLYILQTPNSNLIGRWIDQRCQYNILSIPQIAIDFVTWCSLSLTSRLSNLTCELEPFMAKRTWYNIKFCRWFVTVFGFLHQ